MSIRPEVKVRLEVQDEIEMVLREYGLSATDSEIASISVDAEMHVYEGARNPGYRKDGKRDAFNTAVGIFRDALASRH